MRPDQIERLKDLAETLADVFLTEADPANWSGSGKLPTDMTREERGDRHWCRKGAMGTGAVLRFALDVVKTATVTGAADPHANPQEREASLDQQIAEAEKRAKQALARVLDKAKGKDEFDRRALGKKQPG